MLHQLSRSELLLGPDSIAKLQASRVIVFGIGGVGSYTAEALARSGVGAIDLVDNDDVSVTKINRQLLATHSTVGRMKTDVMAERIHDINPNCKVTTHPCFFTKETADQFDFTQYNYVVDAVDTVSAKLALVECANAAGVPIISCMGAGNKLDPTRFEVADINKTSVCPLARVMRQELRKRGITKLKVVYTKEESRTPLVNEACREEVDPGRRQVPGSLAFVPSVAGLILAGEVVCDLTGVKNR